MDKKQEYKQFFKTMWIMTKYEFLPAITISAALVAYGYFLKQAVENKEFKVEKVENLKLDFFKTKNIIAPTSYRSK